jgi:MOSC domain-containing protein YiiM
MQQQTSGRVLSVNVGRPQSIRAGSREVVTAIWKHPVEGRVHVRRHNIDGDQQADPGAHGGPDKAIYAYAAEDLSWWADALDRPVPPGAFGENLTTAGVDVSGARIGEQWTIGTAVLQVSQPRVPCYKLGVRFDDPTLPRRFAAANRPGAYLRVLTEGTLAAGDNVTVTERPAHGVTVALTAEAYHSHDPEQTAALLTAPGLTGDWHAWAVARLARGSRPAS